MKIQKKKVTFKRENGLTFTYQKKTQKKQRDKTNRVNRICDTLNVALLEQAYRMGLLLNPVQSSNRK